MVTKRSCDSAIHKKFNQLRGGKQQNEHGVAEVFLNDLVIPNDLGDQPSIEPPTCNAEEVRDSELEEIDSIQCEDSELVLILIFIEFKVQT